MSASGGSRAIIAALAANVAIAVIKFVAFLITASSSMLAESVHSLADSGNQLLLLIGRKRASRRATPEHPFGYGRDRYVYGFLVALVLFTVGGLFALYEGIHKVIDPHRLDLPIVAVLVLVAAICLEGWSFRTAVGESRELKGDASWFQFIRRAKVPELPVVLLEDFAALIGLAFALIGVGLSTLLDEPVWDGIGTMGIGVLLIAVALVLIVETKSLLLGEAASPDANRKIAEALVGGGVLRVIHQRTEHLGPDELLVAAKVAMSPHASLAEVAAAIDAAEVRVRAAVPMARLIYLEPDVDRGAQPAADAEAGADSRAAAADVGGSTTAGLASADTSGREAAK